MRFTMAPRLCALPFSCAVGLLAIIIHLSPGEWISLGLYMFHEIRSRQLTCHGNFGPPKILVPGPKFSVKLVRADNIFLKKLVPIQKSWSAHTSAGSAVLAVPSRCIHRVYLPVGRQCSAVRGPAVFLYVQLLR